MTDTLTSSSAPNGCRASAHGIPNRGSEFGHSSIPLAFATACIDGSRARAPVWSSRRVALFVHRCIWNRHPDPACPFTSTPKSRVEFWEGKFAENVARDARQRQPLEAAGWRVLVIWGCETKNKERLGELAATIEACPTWRTPHL